MEDFKNINLTKHCLVRYLNRFKGIAVTENNYDIWKNNHTEEVKIFSAEIQMLFQKSNYIAEGSYGIHKKATFYIEKNDMITFVVDENKLVTVYKIDFGLDDEGNKQMLEVLEKNLRRLLDKEEILQQTNSYNLEKIKKSKGLLNAEIQEVEARLQELRNRKKEYEATESSLKAAEQSIAAKINNAREKIVLSKKVM